MVRTNRPDHTKPSLTKLGTKAAIMAEEPLTWIFPNRCGFHAVEFFNEHHPDPNMPEQFDQEDDGEHQSSGLFKFEKKIR